MPVKVKICGLKTAEALGAAVAAGADFAGFVFYPPSPRALSPDEARALGARTPGPVAKVALVVDGDDDLLASIADALKPDYFQAHGAETPERIRAMRDRFAIPVIKAIKVRDADDLVNAARFRDVAEMILYDARAPDDEPGLLPGCNGVPFDWNLLGAANQPRPYMLSGGLDAGNVTRALAITGAAIVDVSSGVESAPGVKDTGKIAQFVAAVRAAATDPIDPPAGMVGT